MQFFIIKYEYEPPAPPHSSNSFRGFHYIKRLNFDLDGATPDTFGENYSVTYVEI